MCPSSICGSIQKHRSPRARSLQVRHRAWLKVPLAVFVLRLDLLRPRLASGSVTSPHPGSCRSVLPHRAWCITRCVDLCTNTWTSALVTNVSVKKILTFVSSLEERKNSLKQMLCDRTHLILISKTKLYYSYPQNQPSPFSWARDWNCSHTLKKKND